MAIKGILSDSLCWKCSRATDSSCSWSCSFIPVDGWTANKNFIGDNITYNVRKCPMFTRKKVAHNISDTGARSLSNAVIAKAGDEYLKAMEREKKALRKDAALNTKRTLYGNKWQRLYGYKPIAGEIIFCEAFFKSGSAEVFGWDVNPIYIMESIRREVGIRIGQ